jgi:hypothetical protein
MYLPSEIHEIIISNLDTPCDIITYGAIFTINHKNLLCREYPEYYYKNQDKEREMTDYECKSIYYDLRVNNGIIKSPQSIDILLDYNLISVDLMVDEYIVKFDSVKLFQKYYGKNLKEHGTDINYIAGLIFRYMEQYNYNVVKYLVGNYTIQFSLLCSRIIDIIHSNDTVILEILKYIKFNVLQDNTIVLLTQWSIKLPKSFDYILSQLPYNLVIQEPYDIPILGIDLFVRQFVDDGWDSESEVYFKKIFEKYSRYFTSKNITQMCNGINERIRLISYPDTNCTDTIIELTKILEYLKTKY